VLLDVGYQRAGVDGGAAAGSPAKTMRKCQSGNEIVI
jgi:hypothetical protein